MSHFDLHHGLLDYAVNRWYSSVLGRFTSPDPYKASGGPQDPGSWNRYRFVDGDPINHYDPDGLDSITPSTPFTFPCTVGTGERPEVVRCEIFGWTRYEPLTVIWTRYEPLTVIEWDDIHGNRGREKILNKLFSAFDKVRIAITNATKDDKAFGPWVLAARGASQNAT